MQQFLVFVQQGFALGRVGNQQGGLGLKFHGRGKAAAARAYDPEFFHTIEP
jgi:hypothetical protein